MLSALYRYIEQMGYTHPLHPAVTHIPVGCIIAAFLFLLVSRWSRKPAYFQSARHCIGLALLFLPITTLVGFMDWQHNYAGAWLEPIKFKLALAGLLFIFLLIANAKNKQLSRPTIRNLMGYAICLGLVIGLGYFGGEMVYGTPTATENKTPLPKAARNGEDLFRKNCTFCHHHDQAEKKIGPGLKGIFNRAKLTSSGWAMSEENLRKQIKTPYAEMPPFDTLSDQEVTDLVAYLKRL